MTKQAYETPKMESLGSFEEITHSSISGDDVDARFWTQIPSTANALS